MITIFSPPSSQRPHPSYVWAMNINSRISNSNNDSNKEEEEEEEEEETAEDRARCEWDFHLATIISPSTTTREVSDVIGAIEFDPTGHLLATGGISRKIRIYALSSLLPSHGYNPTTNFSDHSTTCKFYICTPAKLSSLRWHPDSGGRIIGSGDYDGVVTEYDVERHVAIFERDEHDGRRVWSMDYSINGELGVSGSDDGSAHIWDRRCNGGTVWAAKAGGAVCSVEFDPGGGPWIGVGSADRHAYVYDIRAAAAGGPVAVLGGHGRAVTYVRFATAAGCGGRRVVTSGTDGTHRLWSWEEGREERVYRGHVNKRSFVGLSVWREGGLVGSGSESGEVFVYDLRWGEPVWVSRWSGDRGDADRGFVSAVSWRQTAGEQEGMLVAGGSDGVLQAFVSKRKAAG